MIFFLFFTFKERN